jgi:uncharacterized membrane protein
MNIKRIFGAILTVLGIGALFYAAIVFVSTNTGSHNVKVLTTFGILGLIFFVSGVSLVRTTKDEA